MDMEGHRAGGSSSLTVSLVGPTAAGKTALAIEIARSIDGEIVNADALQTYRHLEVGTAKPSVQERAAAVHHLLDILEPQEVFSAGHFAGLARKIISEVHSRGRAAVVVGGSGLYHRALFEGLSPTRTIAPHIRRRLKHDLATCGPEALHRRLGQVDAEMALRISPRDGHRIVRALELVETDGVSQIELWRRQAGEESGRGGHLDTGHVIHLGLTLPRALLYDRIESRVAQMFAIGWEDEVRDLMERGIPDEAPAFQAIGYREIVRILRGDTSREAAAQDIAQATRRYAKRQLTWFRRTPGVRWIDAERTAERIDVLLDSLAAVVQQSH